MADVIVAIYLSGWLLTSVALGAWSRLAQNKFGATTVTLGVIAGAMWPVLLLGAIQFGIVVAVTNACRARIWVGSAAEALRTAGIAGTVARRP
jgi:hypothetical protein